MASSSPSPDSPAPDPLAAFSSATRDWFASSFAAPTPAQAQAWPAIASGEHVLLSAPTGSGKTLAAFLWAIDRLALEPGPGGVRVLYVSPLKALSYDIERNLRVPLRGVGAEVTVGIRTGDTSQSERAAMARKPPDILITTPESLYLILGSRARTMLASVETVIVDEIHAVASTKRGAHLALTLERLDEHVRESSPASRARGHGGARRDVQSDTPQDLGEGEAPWALPPAREIQRVGLSATQNPLEEVGRFLVGPTRQVKILDAGVRKPLDLRIQVPVDSMSDLASASSGADPLDPVVGGEATRNSIWPAIYPELLSLVRQHRSTIVFVNNRRSAERVALRLNELAESEIARAHHGSLSREERTTIEEQLKAGTLPCLVATSSLELGIDMGAVDLVLQIESPKSVARGLQRIGRAGHGVGELSKGRIFPKFRGDLLECAVVCHRMRQGLIESTVVPRNALDVLAQQIVAIAASAETRKHLESSRPPEPASEAPSRDRIAQTSPSSPESEGSVSVERLHALVRRTYSYAELSRPLLENVLDMLDGRYPSSEFGDLRPRIVWDRVARSHPGEARAPANSRSPTPARSPTGVSTRSPCPTAGAWASSTRRWSTRRAPVKCSCWAPPRGGSRKSGATA